MFADAKGYSCVLEYGREGMRIIRNEKAYQCITNFRLSDPSMGGYPCARYSRFEEFFGKPGNKEGALAGMLDSVHQEGAYPTIYSYVFDLSRKRLRVFYEHDFGNGKDYVIADLAKRGTMMRIGR